MKQGNSGTFDPIMSDKDIDCATKKSICSLLSHMAENTSSAGKNEAYAAAS